MKMNKKWLVVSGLCLVGAMALTGAGKIRVGTPGATFSIK